MNPTELRVGNWIQSESVSPREPIRRIVLWDFGTYLETDPDAYSPIPLTEEWLLKFGFENDNRSYAYEMMTVPYSKLVVLLKNDYLKVGILYGTLSGGSAEFSHIKYVHQLQNLFHSLTGEELTIKENVTEA